MKNLKTSDLITFYIDTLRHLFSSTTGCNKHFTYSYDKMFSSATISNENFSSATGGLGATAPNQSFCGSSTHTYGENFFEMRDYWGTPYKFNAKACPHLIAPIKKNS